MSMDVPEVVAAIREVMRGPPRSQRRALGRGMKRPASLAAAVALTAAMVISTMPVAAGAAGGGRCPRFRAPRVVGQVRGLPGIREISGIVSSHRHRRTLWVEQDSADPSRKTIHAISPTGRGKASVMVGQATNHDWEDMAYWDRRLWIGDIGDNRLQRSNVQVYWFREPKLSARAVNAKMATLRYPGGRSHNAEAMFVTGGSLYIISKEIGGDTGTVFRADVKPLRDGAHRQLSAVGTIPIGTVAAADVGRRGIIVKNYTVGLFYPWSGNHRVSDTLGRRPCQVPVGPGESIAFTTWSRSYYSIPEGDNPEVYLSRPR